MAKKRKNNYIIGLVVIILIGAVAVSDKPTITGNPLAGQSNYPYTTGCFDSDGGNVFVKGYVTHTNSYLNALSGSGSKQATFYKEDRCLGKKTISPPEADKEPYEVLNYAYSGSVVEEWTCQFESGVGSENVECAYGCEVGRCLEAPDKSGDINSDGCVDVLDGAFIVDVLNGKTEPTKKTDLNGDGTLNILDIVALTNLILEV